ncbi:MAG TPA: HD family hydrolase [Pyrinomonadaceae bacterium]|nr:HD family hydrolase [Pyrinomonadaceae bacterium]
MLPILIELQRLKRLDRTGWILRGLPNGTESVAAHSFGVTATAMILADELVHRGVVVNTERVLRMALLHDWAEARVGDMPKTAIAYFGSDIRKRAEAAAFADIIESAGAAQSLYQDLHADYELRESLESRLVRAADIIDLLVEVLALERAGATGLDEFWEIAEVGDFQLDGVAQELVREIVNTLQASRMKGQTLRFIEQENIKGLENA